MPLGLGTIGCSPSKDDLPREPVAGKVTMDGQPLLEGVIQFYPKENATASSVGANAEIKDGAFSIAREDGLVPGSYKVAISHAGVEGRAGQGEEERHPDAEQGAWPRADPREVQLEERAHSGDQTGWGQGSGLPVEIEVRDLRPAQVSMSRGRDWVFPRRGRIPPSSISVRIRADHLAAVDRPELDPGQGADRVLHEMHRAVAEEAVDAAGMPATRSGKLASLTSLVVAREALDRLTVAQGKRRRRDWCPDWWNR